MTKAAIGTVYGDEPIDDSIKDGFASVFYWSSSQNNAGGAWNQSLGNGYQGGGTENISTLRVRLVRAF
jgi:hypothetical protein